MGREAKRKAVVRARRQQRPSFEAGAPLPIRPVPVPPELRERLLVPGVNDYLHVYRVGECSAIVTREMGRWHLSVAHPTRLPTWDEVAVARYRLLPEGITAAMLMPPRAEYVNVHEHCFQVVEVRDPEWETGPGAGRCT